MPLTLNEVAKARRRLSEKKKSAEAAIKAAPAKATPVFSSSRSAG